MEDSSRKRENGRNSIERASSIRASITRIGSTLSGKDCVARNLMNLRLITTGNFAII
jgi:hypothetical protein